MMRILKTKARLLAPVVLSILALLIASPAGAQLRKAPKDAQGEQFCMVSSVDLQKHQIVLMQPTQLTIVAAIDNSSTILDENGKKLALKDLRAGDTVWAIVRLEKGGQTVAAKIRKGRMTVAELHKLYLDYASQGISAPPPPQQQNSPSGPSGLKPISLQSNPAAAAKDRTRIHHRPGGSN